MGIRTLMRFIAMRVFNRKQPVRNASGTLAAIVVVLLLASGPTLGQGVPPTDFSELPDWSGAWQMMDMG